MKRLSVLSMSALLASMVLASCSQNASSQTSSASGAASSVASSEASSKVESSEAESSVASSEAASSEEETSSEASSEETSGPIDTKNEYNIIVAAATMPPVLSALKSIESGDPTYAWIERGKTYAGIEDTSFVNLGFDAANNTNLGITAAGYASVISKVKELKAADKDAFFNIYVTDYKVMGGVKVAVEGGLAEDEWHIYMASDGSATSANYSKFYLNTYTDESSYEKFNVDYQAAEGLIEEAYASFASTGEAVLTDYQNEFTAGYERCIPLSLDDRFTLLSQVDLSKKTPEGWKLQSIFAEGGDANVDYTTLDRHVASLSESQKDEYLTLMFGDNRAEIDRQFNRTTLDDGTTKVPSKKLVYIGGRVRQSSVGVISTIKSNLSSSYSDLDDEFYQVFEKEEDFTNFYTFLHDEDNWNGLYRRKKASSDASTFSSSAIEASDLTDAQKEDIMLKLTNYYLNYTWNLRFTYRLYGSDYDILFKGHPREDFSLVDNDSWNYVTAYEENAEDGKYYAIDYKQLAHDLIADFYENDSEGKHVGLMPFGVAAENLVYVGGDISFGGMLSSTYSGLSNDTPIVFLLANDESNATAYDQIASKYEEFGLVWKKGTEDEVTLTYYNKALLALTQMSYYLPKKTAEGAPSYYGTIYDKYEGIYNSYVGEGQMINSFGVISTVE